MLAFMSITNSGNSGMLLTHLIFKLVDLHLLSVIVPCCHLAICYTRLNLLVGEQLLLTGIVVLLSGIGTVL